MDYVYLQVPSQSFLSLCIINIWSYLIVRKQILDLAEELQAFRPLVEMRDFK